MDLMAGKIISFMLPMARGLWRFNRPRRAGQTTIEYLLMLAVVAGLVIIIGILFHRRILGGFFTLIGLVIGAGRPAGAP